MSFSAGNRSMQTELLTTLLSRRILLEKEVADQTVNRERELAAMSQQLVEVVDVRVGN